MSQFGIVIVPGSEVRSDPPCHYDWALIEENQPLLGRVWGVIRKVWDA